MKQLFNNLFISSPNGGGLFFIHENTVFKLDDFQTTGLSVKGRQVLRGLQPLAINFYNGSSFSEITQKHLSFNDIHDVYLGDDHHYLVGTAGNEVVQFDSAGQEIQRWVFAGEEDALHINCLTSWNGRIVFSAFGEFGEHRGYKGRTRNAGFVQDLHSGKKVIIGLSQPHSLVPSGANLLLANSECRQLAEYDQAGNVVRTLTLDGYTRGICIMDGIVYVGLSRSRNIEEHNIEAATVVALDHVSWRELGRIQLPAAEIYTIQGLADPVDIAHVLANISSSSSIKSASLIAEKNNQIHLLNQEITERDRQIIDLGQTITEQQTHIAELDQVLASHRNEISHLNHTIAASNAHIVDLERETADSSDRLSELGKVIAGHTEVINTLKQSIANLDDALAATNYALRRKQAPLRVAKRAVTSILRPFEAYRLSRDIHLVKRSGLFDVGYYLQTARDIRLITCDPIRHFCEFGWRERRNPSLVFDSGFYLSNYSDVASAGINPLVHYVKYGRKEGRLTTPNQAGSLNAVDHIPSSFFEEWLRSISERQPNCNGISKAVVGACALPATLFCYPNGRAWLQAITQGRVPFVTALNRPDHVRARLQGTPRWIRIPTSTLLSVALRIRANGGILPAMRSMYRIVQKEGRHGVLARLLNGTPLVPARQYLNSPPADPRRILVMDYRIPQADVSAGERATLGMLRDLCALGYQVVFMPNNLASSPSYEAELERLGIEIITGKQGYFSSAHYISQHGHEFSAFYLIRVDVAESVLSTIRQASPSARVIFHAPDLYFLRESRKAELENDDHARASAQITKDREFDIMRRVDHVVVVSPAEVPYLKASLPDVSISVFPALYVPVQPDPPSFYQRQNIFFLGGFGHPPNVGAMLWFVKEVWPLVRQRLPEAEFHIVGAEVPAAVQELASEPGVKVIGFVADLDPILAAMRVGVAPLLYGAGIKGKVGMTMGAGIPCVCTTVAAEGMHIQNQVHAIIADEAQTFADAVVQLYSDENTWSQLSRNGQILVQQSFGEAANRSSFLDVLDSARSLPIGLFTDYCKALPPRAIPQIAFGATIDVSIIVPVYNQWHLTRACLNSILETSYGHGINLEIIIADDGSTDETVNAVEMYPGLKIVRTERNVGFLRNCNNAARQAKGRHLLLLNNDTIVLPGWLTSLYRTLEDDSGIAIAGSKLLYPDGLIQEAGAVLFSDGTAHNVGRGYDRHTAVFNIEREVDYISGASILIRRSFWDSVGGFDERYKNAYCEDSDLAMTARASGMRVVYQPASEVVHFEHQTYADQAPAHNSELQNHNIRLLLEKWWPVFEREHYPVVPWQIAASHAERSAPPAALARRKEGKLNILYFSPFPSHPASHGNRSTINQFANSFKRMGHSVHFALLQSNEYIATDLENMRSAWDTLDIIAYSNPMLADENSIPFDAWYEEGIGEHIRCLCDKYSIDVVFCSYIFQSKLLEYVPAHILKVIDTHDKMGDRYEMLRANGQPLEFFSCSPDEEGAYLQRADIVIARRQEEANYFDSVSGRTSAIVVPHVEEAHIGKTDFPRLSHVGVVASANRINLALVQQLLAAIEQKLGDKPCSFIVHVAGQVKDMIAALPSRQAAVFSRPWVRMHGFVPDIATFYADMDLIVSPVTMGTGINVKTVQAMAFGMPLLTTAWGAKGIETSHPMHNHPDLSSLAESLFYLAAHPNELNGLANLSRERYQSFYQTAQDGMRTIFAHPKLSADADRSHTPIQPFRIRAPLDKASPRFPLILESSKDFARDLAFEERTTIEQEASNKLKGAQRNSSASLRATCHTCGPVDMSFSRTHGWIDPSTNQFVINWREHLVCPRCGLNNRMRAIVHLLDMHSTAEVNLPTYITEQTTQLFRVLQSRYANLIGSEFLGEACPFGQTRKGIRNEDMTQLTFADSSLARILSFDVLEHIPHYKKALSEAYRCLAPGGQLWLSAPFNASSEETFIRAKLLEDGDIHHLAPPEYHGDPINPGEGVLCFQTFGWDLLDVLRSLGFEDVKAIDYWSREFGYLGGTLVFSATKPTAFAAT